MNKIVGCFFILTSLLMIGCASTPTTDTVYQTSTIDALLAGVYDGELTLNKLLTHGDFGIGTFDCLDGEMIIVDGEIYQIKADGKVYKPEMTIKTPFATVCDFTPEQSITIQTATDMEQLEAIIDSIAPNQNLFYAFRMEGKFTHVRTRSVPGQSKPYPPLKEVTANQPEFEMENVTGTLVGFRCPPFVEGINVPGYHLHFLSKDKSQGGHVLEFTLVSAQLKIDQLNRYVLELPKETEDFASTDLSQDRAEELEEIEN
ncbi:acetolactate decarboxylase [candidate division KSB1 bacterium]|nr:acetolactate decarboxylase [candidate division KSB1 bacterium]